MISTCGTGRCRQRRARRTRQPCRNICCAVHVCCARMQHARAHKQVGVHARSKCSPPLQGLAQQYVPMLLCDGCVPCQHAQQRIAWQYQHGLTVSSESAPRSTNLDSAATCSNQGNCAQHNWGISHDMPGCVPHAVCIAAGSTPTNKKGDEGTPGCALASSGPCASSGTRAWIMQKLGAHLLHLRAQLLGDDGANVIQHLCLVLCAPGPKGELA